MKTKTKREREAIAELRTKAMEFGYVPRPSELSQELRQQLRTASGSVKEGYEAAGLPYYPHGRPRQATADARHPLPAWLVNGDWED